MSSLQETDQAAAAVAVAPRVTLEDIEGRIAWKYFVTGDDAVRSKYDEGDDEFARTGNTDYPVPLAIMTLCFLVTTNGFTVVGKSAPASPENFDADLGKKFAYEDAIRQLWPLYGFALREQLSQA